MKKSESRNRQDDQSRSKASSDEELLKLALAAPSPGSERVGDLMLRFLPTIRRFVSSRVSESEIDDIVSLVLERASRNLRSVRAASVPRFRVWLYQIARHAIVDFYREADRRAPSVSLDSAQPSSVALNPDSVIELQTALDQLGGINRALLLLSSVHGYRVKEIKDIMSEAGQELSVTAIYNRISRARARLKQLLDLTDSS